MESFRSGDRTIGIEVLEPTGPGPFPAILLLHGSGGNIGFWLDRFRPYLQRFGIALYAVHYFDRTGTARADAAMILDGVHFPAWLGTIGDAVSFLETRPRIDAHRIALLGISLGAFLALALAVGDRRIRAVVEISGGLAEPFAARSESSFPPTLILHGDADTVVPVTHARELDARLTRLNVPHQTHIYPGEGHWFSSAAQMQILGAVAGFLGRYLRPAS